MDHDLLTTQALHHCHHQTPFVNIQHHLHSRIGPVARGERALSPTSPLPALVVVGTVAPEGLAAAALAAALSSRISFCALARAAEGSEGSPAVVEYVECATAR